MNALARAPARPALARAAPTVATCRTRTGLAALAPSRLALAALCALQALALTTPSGRIAAKAVVDPLLHSTSDANLWLALAAALAALTTASWCDVRGAAGIDARYRARAHAIARLLGGALATCGALGLLLQLHLLLRLRLPLDARVHLFVGDTNTVTSLPHNHMGKAALSLLAGTFGVDVAGTGYDAGAALHDLVPRWLAALDAAAFALAVCAALALLPGVARAGANANGRVSLAWLLLYAFSALTCLKGVLDGGVLHYAVAPAAVTLAWLLRSGGPARFTRHAWRWLAAVGLASAIALSLANALSHAAAKALWLAWLPGAALLGVLVACLPAQGPARRTGWRWLGGLCAAWLLLVWAHAAHVGVGQLLAPAGAARLVVFDAAGRPHARIARPGTPAQTLAEVYDAQGEDPLKPARTFVQPAGAASTRARGERVFLLFPLAAPVPRRDAVGFAGYRADARAAVAWAAAVPGALWLRVRPTPGLPPLAGGAGFVDAANAQVHLHAIAAALRRAGFHAYALVPVADGEAAADATE